MKRTRSMARGAVLALAVVAAVGMTITARQVSAELRNLEVVGVEPLVDGSRPVGVPRQRAVEKALWEGVSRVALDLIEEHGPPVSETGSDGATPPSGDGQGDPADSGEEGGAWLHEALGDDMTPFARSFRIVEDQGIRPALFSTQKGATKEYVVVVDVRVDVDRVRSRLASRGLIYVEDTSGHGEGLEIEVTGLRVWPAYQTFLSLLLTADVGGQEVRPLAFERGRTLVWLGVTGSPEQVLERLLAASPPSLQITPLEVEPVVSATGLGRAFSMGGAPAVRAPRIRLAVRWTPSLVEESESGEAR
jgi:hypothetical protein